VHGSSWGYQHHWQVQQLGYIHAHKSWMKEDKISLMILVGIFQCGSECRLNPDFKIGPESCSCIVILVIKSFLVLISSIFAFRETFRPQIKNLVFFFFFFQSSYSFSECSSKRIWILNIDVYLPLTFFLAKTNSYLLISFFLLRNLNDDVLAVLITL
jgi:hypothetical protein